VYSWFDTAAVVFGAAIRGAGDTLFAMVFSVTMGVVLLVLPTYVASHYGSQGFAVAWYAVTVFVSVLGIGFWARFQQGRWKSMRVIEHTAPELAEERELETVAS
jgi:MATE family multidrug resistance protein